MKEKHQLLHTNLQSDFNPPVNYLLSNNFKYTLIFHSFLVLIVQKMFNFQISKFKENRFWFWNEPKTLPWLLVGANSSVQSYKKGKWSKRRHIRGIFKKFMVICFNVWIQ